MKKLQFFVIFVLISLLGLSQVKADTIHIQMPAGAQPFCQSNGFDTFIFHKSAGFGPTVWRIDNVLVGSGDSLIYTPNSIGMISVSCIWSGAEDGCLLYLYPSAPSHAIFVAPINATNDTIWKCTAGGISVFSNTIGSECTSYGWYGANMWFNTNDDPVTIPTTGTYWFTRENPCGITRDTFYVVALPFSAPILSDTIFCNQTSNKTFDAGTGWSSYIWSTGATSQTITPVITTDGIHQYTLTVTNVCGTYNSGASIEVQHFPMPGFPIPIGPYCNDTTLVVNPNPNYVYDTYTWSTGDTTQFIYVNDDLSWTCTVTQGGCSKSSSRSVRFYEEPLIPEVCVVTVDASMVKNKIVWSSDLEPDSEDPEYKTIESYNIYKLVNDWILIGTVSVGDDHVFTDMSSNPPTQSAMYKITAVDGCGNESEKSFYHKTILLLANQGAYPGQIPLNWNQYQDESGLFEVSQYYIYRGPSMGQLSLYDSVPGMMTSYIDTGIYTQTFYQIVVFKAGGCDSTPANLGKGSKSITDGLIMSNVTQIGVGIAENQIEITIYPNPSNTGIFTIKGENITNVEVYNTIGQRLPTQLQNGATIDLSSYANGIYYAKISTEKGDIEKKLVKQ